MTVKELKQELSKYPDDADVIIQYRDSGGYYHGYSYVIEICYNKYSNTVEM